MKRQKPKFKTGERVAMDGLAHLSMLKDAPRKVGKVVSVKRRVEIKYTVRVAWKDGTVTDESGNWLYHPTVQP